MLLSRGSPGTICKTKYLLEIKYNEKSGLKTT
jgi:hypothetical protein